MVVPADAGVGGYLQASVSRDEKEYHFSVVVPEGVIAGVTTLTVPVPIPKASALGSAGAQAGAAAFPIAALPPNMAPPPPPPLPPSSAGGKPQGMDVAASYLMDRGVDDWGGDSGIGTRSLMNVAVIARRFGTLNLADNRLT